MKRINPRIIILLLVAFFGACVLFAYRVRLMAWAWHFRHGETVEVGNCIVPVPANWYVQAESDGGQLLVRIDTEDHAIRKRLQAHASILAVPGSPLKEEDLKQLLAIDRASLEKEGVKQIVEKRLSTDGGTFFCIGGGTLSSNGTYDTDPSSWRCKSGEGLQLGILATESDLPQVWQMLSSIRKKT